MSNYYNCYIFENGNGMYNVHEREEGGRGVFFLAKYKILNLFQLTLYIFGTRRPCRFPMFKVLRLLVSI